MSKKTKTVDAKHSASSNFGRWGWWIIIYTAILMFLANGCQTDGLNLLVSKFAYVNGWDANTVLAMSTPCGLCGSGGGRASGLADYEEGRPEGAGGRAGGERPQLRRHGQQP